MSNQIKADLVLNSTKSWIKSYNAEECISTIQFTLTLCFLGPLWWKTQVKQTKGSIFCLKRNFRRRTRSLIIRYTGVKLPLRSSLVPVNRPLRQLSMFISRKILIGKKVWMRRIFAWFSFRKYLFICTVYLKP